MVKTRRRKGEAAEPISKPVWDVSARPPRHELRASADSPILGFWTLLRKGYQVKTPHQRNTTQCRIRSRALCSPSQRCWCKATCRRTTSHGGRLQFCTGQSRPSTACWRVGRCTRCSCNKRRRSRNLSNTRTASGTRKRYVARTSLTACRLVSETCGCSTSVTSAACWRRIQLSTGTSKVCKTISALIFTYTLTHAFEAELCCATARCSSSISSPRSIRGLCRYSVKCRCSSTRRCLHSRTLARSPHSPAPLSPRTSGTQRAPSNSRELRGRTTTIRTAGCRSTAKLVATATRARESKQSCVAAPSGVQHIWALFGRHSSEIKARQR